MGSSTPRHNRLYFFIFHIVLNHTIDFCNMAIRIIFLSQITSGILGNGSLIICSLVFYYKKYTIKPTDLILRHLMVANTLIILSNGVPNTLSAFGFKQYLNDFGCKFLIFIHGFCRSVSIGAICLLSVFQAITIGTCWKHKKVKHAKYIGCSICLLWVFYVLIHLIFFVYPYIEKKKKNMTRKHDFGYCSFAGRNKICDSLYAALVVCPEVLFSVLMVWSSGSMIIVLYRHKHRVQHIHSTHGSNKSSPESRATQNTMVLVSFFLVFYNLSSTLRGCIALLSTHSWWLVNITHIISLCFPCFGPFFLMNRYSIAYRLRLVRMKM